MAPRRFGAFYARSFERRPWVTLAIANGTLGAIADTLAQTFERYQQKPVTSSSSSSSSLSSEIKEKGTLLKSSLIINSKEEKSWDFARTARFIALGVMMAPILDQWNRFIEFRFPLRTTILGATSSTSGKVSLAALGKRVAIDQIGFAPFGLACFVGAMGFMEGRNVEGVETKFKEMFIPALVANWKVWPAVQTINFRFMPLRYRVPFTGAIGIAWQVFLSILNSAKRIDEKEIAVAA